MFEMKKLTKQEIKKYLILTSVSALLILSFILLMAAWSNNAVVIHDGEKTLDLKTRGATVSEVLSDAGIVLGSFDTVEPGKNETVVNGMTITIYRAVKISVSDEGEVTEYLSSAQTVQEILDQAGYTLLENDRVVPSGDSAVTKDMVIEVRRAKDFTVIDESGEKTVNSSAATVGELIDEMGIALDENIHVNLDSSVKLKEGMKIKISKVLVKYEDVKEIVPYNTEKRNSSKLAKGTTKVAQEGKNGLRVVTYKVKYKDGVEIGREEVSTVVERKVVNRIVEVGTKIAYASTKPAPSSATVSNNSQISSKGFSYSKVITCSASAYDLSYESCGKRPGDPHYGITASGMKAQYGVIAVDPRVIPLGTKLYVEAVDGSWSYGFCVAGDTGGGIKGNRIDLFYNSRAEAIAFGRRQAKVYILN